MDKITIKHIFCPICNAGCGLILEIKNNKAISVRPDKEHPISKGYCCPKGEQTLLHQRLEIYSPKIIIPNERLEIRNLNKKTGKETVIIPTSGPAYEYHQRLRKNALQRKIRYDELREFFPTFCYQMRFAKIN